MEFKKCFKIVILDINKFFNSALTIQIQQYSKTLSLSNDCTFDVRSYTNARRCVSNLNKGTDLAYVGYYEQAKNLPVTQVVQFIKEECENCRIVLLSQIENLETAVLNIREDVIHFIFKDRYVLLKSCLILDGVVSGKVY